SNQRSSRGSRNRQSMGKGSLCWCGITESPPLGVTPGAQNNSPGGWGNRGKTGGGTEDQVRAEEVGLDRGAVIDSGALEDLDPGTVTDSETLEDLGRGAVADCETLEQKSTMVDSDEPGAMVEQGEQAAMAGQVGQAEQEAMAGQTEQAEQGAMAGQAEQGVMAGQAKQAEQGAMAGQAEQGVMAGQAKQAEQGAMAGQAEQTGAKIPTVEQMTSIAEQRVHDRPSWP
ncbi:hypothetical protein M9458_053834, partial [Cirrhinus mrigala]